MVCCCCCCCGAITIESQWPVGTRKSLHYPSFSYSMPDFERLVGVEGFVICTGQKITWTSGNQSHHIARPKAMYRIGLQYLQKDHLVAQTMYIGITSATSSSVFFRGVRGNGPKFLESGLLPCKTRENQRSYPLKRNMVFQTFRFRLEFCGVYNTLVWCNHYSQESRRRFEKWKLQ